MKSRLQSRDERDGGEDGSCGDIASVLVEIWLVAVEWGSDGALLVGWPRPVHSR
jgi:hypothetical protein